jgi:hypothetical protein
LVQRREGSPAAFGDGDANFGDAAGMVGLVAEVDRAAVGFDDLAGEREADAGTGLLGRVERDEDVIRIGETGAVVPATFVS